TVTLYVGPKNQPEYYDYLVALNPKRVIFNPGTENPELYGVLEKNNIKFQNACTLVLLGTNQY
ncbi:CoA-binding protein, partial [Zunongwangia profunda]